MNPARLAAVLLLLCLPAVCAAQTAPPAAPAVWKPDPKLLAQLGPEVSVGDYRMRLPKGYGFAAQPHGTELAADATKVYAWRGTSHSNLRSASLFITLIPLDKGEKSPTLRPLISAARKYITDHFPDAMFTHAQQGSLNGFPFAYSRWQGHDKTNIPTQGTNYVGVGNRIVFSIGMIDSVPYSATSLPLMEAAALTFRKG